MGLLAAKPRSPYRLAGQAYSARVGRGVRGRFDFAIAAVVAILVGMGLMTLYSAVMGLPGKEALFATQLRWVAVCAAMMFFVYLIDYHVYSAAAYSIFAVNALLLALTLLVGQEVKGASRWLGIGSFTFQPSELSKITLVLALAHYFANTPRVSGYRLVDLLPPLGITLVPTVLILLEPDLGTAVLHLAIFAAICLFVGVRKKSLVGAFVSGVLALPVLWFFVFHDYQRARILTLFNPEADPLGTGYHIRQSLIAVGSGKMFGKGFLDGSQTKLQFLPETHTDFIFSVVAEEWGFLGCLIVLALFFTLVIWGVNVAASSKDRFGSIAAFGLVSILFWHVIINVGMVLNLLPVVGVILPFFSYGRTSVFVMLCVVTMLLNINGRRYVFE
ncbi:rod shape-determining protein RodA [bacterium]|nr:rod shape-determining protein RodA [bacterium]